MPKSERGRLQSCRAGNLASRQTSTHSEGLSSHQHDLSLGTDTSQPIGQKGQGFSREKDAVKDLPADLLYISCVYGDRTGTEYRLDRQTQRRRPCGNFLSVSGGIFIYFDIHSSKYLEFLVV